MNPERKRRLVTAFQKYVLNPISKPFAGFIGPSLIETTGNRSGRRRRTPVGATYRGGAFWIVSEQGRHSAYVRNIKANNRVRVRYRGRWHEGTAHLLPHENARRHLHGLNGLMVRLVGTELLTIRIDPKQR